MLLVYSVDHAETVDEYFRMLAEHGGAAMFVAAVLVLLVELALAQVRQNELEDAIRKVVAQLHPTQFGGPVPPLLRDLCDRCEDFRKAVCDLAASDIDWVVAFIHGYFNRVAEAAERVSDACSRRLSNTWLEIPARKTLVDEAFAMAMESLGPGDRYVAVTCPKFWSAWNLGSRDIGTGRFLGKCTERAANDQIAIQRAFVVYGTRDQEGKWRINRESTHILRVHARTKGVAVRVWISDDAAAVQRRIADYHMGAWILSRGQKERFFAFKPSYFERDPYILERINVVFDEGSVADLLNGFEQSWDEAMDLSQFLSEQLSDASLTPWRDPTRPYPGRNEWSKYYETLYAHR